MLHSHTQHSLSVPPIVEDHDVLCAKRWICAEMGLDPDDPELCAKVNVYMAAQDAQAAAKPRELMEAAE